MVLEKLFQWVWLTQYLIREQDKNNHWHCAFSNTTGTIFWRTGIIATCSTTLETTTTSIALKTDGVGKRWMLRL